MKFILSALLLASMPVFGAERIPLGENILVLPTAKVTTRETSILQPILEAVSITKIEGAAAYIMKGRVVSSNTGSPAGSIFIYFGRSDADAPVLAAMTNLDGEFKFSLPIIDDPDLLDVGVAPDLSGYLYIGGKPTMTTYGDLRLFSGSTRYLFKELLRYSESRNSPSGPK